MYRNVTLESYNWLYYPIFEMSGITFPVGKGNNWKGKNSYCFSMFVMSTSHKNFSIK